MQYSTSESRNALDVKNLCSRKLYELLARENQLPLSHQQRDSVEQELIARKHFLNELGRLRGRQSML